MSEANWAALLSSWSFSPVVLVWIGGLGALYFRGWLGFVRRKSPRFGWGRLACFLAGLLTILVALQSPIDVLSSFSLQVHMIQHLLLMVVAPILLLLGHPMLPIIGGLPRSIRENWLTPFAVWPPLRRSLARLFHPVTTWCLYVITIWVWHSPRAYDLALSSSSWHRFEHACFLSVSLLFWFPVLRPFPVRPSWSEWVLVPYLFFAGIQGTALSGILTFAERVLYKHYETTPNIWGISPLSDQSIAGAIMWVPGSLALLVALVWVVGRQFSRTDDSIDRSLHRSGAGGFGPSESDLTTAMRATRATLSRCQRSNVSRVTTSKERRETSLFHPLFKHRLTRRGLQLTMVVLAIAVIVDGITGPQVAAVNLAGVLPWIHWRGLLVLTLLVGGNFFCMVCPFTALRSIANLASRRASGLRLGPSFGSREQLRWPKLFSNKWLAIGVLVVFFWAYEAFALWDRPFATAMITILFFATAMVCDAIFVDAPFCKFVCPIGQYNFIQSLVSPTEIAVRNEQVCVTCTTRDCIAGNSTSPGCQTSLFLPRKSGNMDCTCCYDCVDACPHDNAALVPVHRVADLVADPNRSGVGRYRDRFDITFLILVLFFAAVVNAAWMTSPVIAVEGSLVAWFGVGRLPVMTIGMVIVLGMVPPMIVAGVAWLSLYWGGEGPGLRNNIGRYAPALIPLSLGMWLAHYSFHLFTTADSALVAAGRAWSEWTGAPYEIGPVACGCCKADSIAWLLPLELCMLGWGLCLSLAALYRIASRPIQFEGGGGGNDGKRPRWSGPALRSILPWSLLMTAFYFACVWILLQPMQMRGAIS